MRIAKDVSIHQAGGEGLAVVSTTPGVVGEELTLELVSGEETAELRVAVVDSRPAMVDGMLVHRLRLRRLPTFDERT
jgi:hypothetical protein